MFSKNLKLAPNGTIIDTKADIESRTNRIMLAQDLYKGLLKETASDEGYAPPLAGSAPPGFGYSFSDTYRRTGATSMDFQRPANQVDAMNTSLKYAFHDVFVGKALRVKTNFTCKGLQYKTGNDAADSLFTLGLSRLNLVNLYRQAVWMYHTLGVVPVIHSGPNDPMDFVDILDPRMVRIVSAFGKNKLFIVPDIRMINAVKDPTGRQNVLNKALYDIMPAAWSAQIKQGLTTNPGYNPSAIGAQGEMLITPEDGSYQIITNRYNSVNLSPTGFNGLPLEPYFDAAAQYHQLMAGDFAAGFVAKNLIAIVSVGDPKTEGDNYIRPDTATLQGLQSFIQNANQAQYVYADATTQIRYSTPDPEVFNSEKYKDSKEQLKNLLPSPFWYNEGGGSFAGASAELKLLREEIEACNDQFDTNFWVPINARMADNTRVGAKNVKPPNHDRNSLQEDAILLANLQAVYNDGGLSNRSLLEALGFDYDVELTRKKAEMAEIKAGNWMPGFEQKQGIVADVLYGIKPTGPQTAGDGGKGGHPTKPGSPPQVEQSTGRAPRPSES